MSALPDTRPPLVVDLGRGFYAWMQNAIGFIFTPGLGWKPITDVEAPGIGGRVVTSKAEFDALVKRVGKPLP